MLGNEFKNNLAIQATLDLQRQQGGVVQFHEGDPHYASTDLLSGSERKFCNNVMINFEQHVQDNEFRQKNC